MLNRTLSSTYISSSFEDEWGGTWQTWRICPPWKPFSKNVRLQTENLLPKRCASLPERESTSVSERTKPVIENIFLKGRLWECISDTNVGEKIDPLIPLYCHVIEITHVVFSRRVRMYTINILRRTNTTIATSLHTGVIPTPDAARKSSNDISSSGVHLDECLETYIMGNCDG